MRNLSRHAEDPTKHARISRTAHHRIDIRRHRPLRRNQLIDRVEVLSKVKALFLIPGIEMMSTNMVADFYDVDASAIRMCYTNHKKEIEPDGTMNIKPALLKQNGFTLEKAEGKPSWLFEVGGKKYNIMNNGIRAFSPRAVLRIGMLLRDSEVAKEVRTQPIAPDVKTIR